MVARTKLFWGVILEVISLKKRGLSPRKKKLSGSPNQVPWDHLAYKEKD